MSKAEFETIMQVGDVLKGFQTMEKLLSEPPQVLLSNEAQEKWEKLTKQYDAFYELDINDRLVFSQMGGVPKEPQS